MQIAMPSETSAPQPRTLNASDATDAELATLACANKLAFAELYRRHLDRVYRYLLVRVGNPHDAEDLTAQTFMQAMQRITQFRGQGEFTAWLLSIARNKANDYFRGRHETASLEDLPGLSDAQPALDDAVAERLQWVQVAQALRAIAPDRAEALVLRIFGELSMAEVGRVLGKSEAAAKMLVSRALADLRTRLDVHAQGIRR